MHSPKNEHRIVIVGGGAGGLELATRLGDTLGKRGRAEVVLIDKNRTHVWKPKLHEIASGSMDMSAHEVDYLAQAHWHGFRFRVGELTGIDRDKREVQVAPYLDDEGRLVTPARSFPYDTLVLAIGSLSNDFGTPGVREHAMRLESKADAQRFHARMVNACIRAHAQTTPLAPEQLHVAIIGAGATGVELAAELHRTTHWGGDLTADAGAWLDQAESVNGSWWPAWSDWLATHAGPKVAARRTPGNAAHPAIEPAPGRYVKTKAA